MFYFEKYKENTVLKSDLLKEVNHFFTTRDWKGFDCLETNRLIRPEQTHSDNIGIVDYRNEYPNTDALILAEKDTTICLKFADCTPIILYDTENKIGAISHAGWKGTASKIGQKTVLKMQEKFSTKPENVIAIIGPTISLCCYEVSEDVKEKLLSTVTNREGLFINKKVDLKGINAQQLKEIGVNQIDICPYCTSCNNDKFYSYRKENGTPNRHYAMLSIPSP